MFCFEFWKFNDWELKGVPLRLEYGPKDAAKSVLSFARCDTGDKGSLAKLMSLQLAEGPGNRCEPLENQDARGTQFKLSLECYR
jgi:hypothetical protein